MEENVVAGYSATPHTHAPLGGASVACQPETVHKAVAPKGKTAGRRGGGQRTPRTKRNTHSNKDKAKSKAARRRATSPTNKVQHTHTHRQTAGRQQAPKNKAQHTHPKIREQSGAAEGDQPQEQRTTHTHTHPVHEAVNCTRSSQLYTK